MAGKKKVSTGSFMGDMLEDLIKKENCGATEYVESYSTSIDMLDYRNGRIEDDEIIAGIDGGKILTIIGKPGSGKTSLALQIGFNIIKQYENAQMIHMDYENASTKGRINTFSGMTKEEMKFKYKYLNENIYTETLYSLVKAMAKIKLEKYEELKVDTGRLNDEGKPIYVLPPTVFLVDSWASVVPKTVSEEEDISGQMTATSIARQNNSLIKRITMPMGKSNIILIVVNHITKKVEIGKK